ncbi:MAG: hypothetical protein ACE5D3_04535, partial [Candidatus Binatia bacterium]
MAARSLSSFPPQGAVASGGSAAGLPDNLVVDNTTGGTDLDVSTGDSIAGVAELALVSDAGAITIDATGGSVEINSSTGDVSLGNDAVAQSVNVGTGAA